MNTIPRRSLKVLELAELAKELSERKPRLCGAWKVEEHPNFLFVDVTYEVVRRYDPERDIPVIAFYEMNGKENLWKLLGSRVLTNWDLETAERLITHVLGGNEDREYRIGFRSFELEPYDNHACEHCP